MVLADKKNIGIVIDEVSENSHAEKAGIKVGDILVECSSVVLKSDAKSGEYENEGYGARPYNNWEKRMFVCEGEDFNIVMNANHGGVACLCLAC